MTSVSTILLEVVVISSWWMGIIGVGCLGISNLSKVYSRNTFLSPFFKNDAINLSFFPKSNFYALNRISTSFPQDEIIGIIGPSGCGKSTLGNLLLGKEQPSSGSVLFDRGSKVLPVKVTSSINNLYDNRMSVGRVLYKTDDSMCDYFRVVLREVGIDDDKIISELLRSEAVTFDILGAMKNEFSQSKQINNCSNVVLMVFDEYFDKDVPSIQRKCFEILSKLILLGKSNRIPGSPCVQPFIVTHSRFVALQCDYLLSLERGRLLDSGKNLNDLLISNLIDFT